MWSDATASIPSIEERLASLERSIGEMTRTMRQMMDRSPSMSSASTSQLARSVATDETASYDGSPPSPLVPKPVHMIQELHSEFFGEMDGFGAGANFSSDIVSKGIIDSKLSLKLTQLFVDQFGSRISIDNLSDLHDMGRTDPFLFSTACLLASRYVPGMPQQAIRAMYLQVRHAASNALWNTPPLAYESLQALTLLCLWSPTIQKGALMDSWLLSGISINHALISFDFLDCVPAGQVSNDMFKKLRLWNSLCLTQLHFAIGNARPFNIQQRYLDHCPRILEHPSATSEDGKVVAEIQLYLITLKIQKTSQRMQYADSEYEEIERWKMEWAHLLTSESSLQLSLWFCQLLLHRTIMRLHPECDRLIPEIIQISRLIVSKFMQIRFSVALGFIDQTYFIVGYAALTLCDFNVMDPLIDQIQTFLLHLSPNEDHIAYRFSCIIAELRRRHTEENDPFRIVKGTLFSDPSKMNVDQAEFMPSLMNTVVDEYEALEQLIPGLVPSNGFPAPMFDTSMHGAIPGVMVRNTL
ncbi:hypothetical protein MW887_010929 [Aspergillus wentii]|nr:hypothetical protein MW887_010929 [Aspergillus wentii]